MTNVMPPRTIATRSAWAYAIFTLVILAPLLGGCENGVDWDRLVSWTQSGTESSNAETAKPDTTATPAASVPLATPATSAPPTVPTIAPAATEVAKPDSKSYRICRECIVSGDRIVPTTDRVLGQVEHIERGAEAVSFVGWAFDQERPNASLRLVVFADGLPVGEGTTDIMRLDIVVKYKLSATGRPGFSIKVPTGMFQKPNVQVSVYARDSQGAMGAISFASAN